MLNRPNRAHTEAPVMSFERQVAQVLDSLTKELTMSEPPAGPLDAANEYAARTQHDTELLTAYEEANSLRAWMDGPELGDEDVPDWAIAKYSRLISVIAEKPAFTAGGVVAKLQTFTREIEGCVYSHIGEGRTEGLLPQFIRTALEGAQRLTGSAADWAPETTRIPELGITFAEAAERYRSLRRAEMEASQRGDQGAADDANRQHCRLADQIMDATPSTPADAMVILSMLADREMGIAAGIEDERAQRALERVHTLLSAARQPQGQSEEGELSAMVCRWLELRDIADPSEDQTAEHDRLFNRIAAYQPRTSADALALLVCVLTCYMGDSIIELQDDGSGYARALQKGLAYFASAGDPAAGTLYRLGPIGLIDERAFWVHGVPADCAEATEDGSEADAEAEDDDEEELPVVDRTGSGLSKAEVRLMNVLDRMGPDDKEAMILTGRAMIALGDVMKAAQKAAAVDQRWAEFIAKLLREDAAKLNPEGHSGLVAANGDSATADPFSDAVEDIGAQASATLSMPLEMTDRMIDAGASAAGITPDQFKAAVKAAREARAA